MRAIDAYGNRVVRAALILTALTAIRPGTLRVPAGQRSTWRPQNGKSQD